MLCRVLLVEDDDVDCEWVSRLLDGHSTVSICLSAKEARKAVRTRQFDCALVDYGLPDVDGAELVRELTAEGLPVIILTGQGDATQAVRGMKAGAYDYLTKDKLDRERLRNCVSKASEVRALETELRRNQTKLDEARQASLERERRLSLIFETIRETFWTADSERTRFLYLSPQVSQTWGLSPSDLEEGHGKLLQAVRREDVEGLTRAWGTTGNTYEVEYRILAEGGETKWLRERGSKTMQDGKSVWVGVTEDVTQRKELERQFIQSQKMEALGRLAGGLSHDFNNLLTCMLGYTEVIKECAEVDAPYLEDLYQVEEAGQKARELIKQLLTFSRSKVATQGSTNLNRTILDLRKMLHRTMGEEISIVTEVESPDLYVAMEQSRLEQILINLAVNAKDAMPCGGQLTIKLTSAGRRAHLRVKDSGEGMSTSTRQKIFEPFFTTKGDKGTGLGLSTVFGLVTDHGGEIKVESEPGRGTEFFITLPLLSGGVSSGSLGLASSEQKQEYLPPVYQKILLVENREALRSLFARVLNKEGFTVVEAADGLEGFIKAEPELSTFSAIVTDVKMPGIGGKELVRRCREVVPNLPVLFISGFSGDEFEQEGLESNQRLLEKPFTGPQLVEAVKDLLRAGGP